MPLFRLLRLPKTGLLTIDSAGQFGFSYVTGLFAGLVNGGHLFTGISVWILRFSALSSITSTRTPSAVG
jgi:hypothetical protein